MSEKKNNDRPMVCGIGECLWDIMDNEKRLGGAPMNFAYHVGQLLGMDNAVAISSIGDDDLGRMIVEEYDKGDLRHALAIDSVHKTGIVEVKLNDACIPNYEIVEDVAWDYIPVSSDVQEIVSNARIICFGTLAQRSMVSRSSISIFLNLVPKDCLIVFDVNLRGNYYSPPIIEQSMQRCNIMKLNDEELPVVCQLFGVDGDTPEGCCRKIMSLWNINTIIYTCGAKGSYIFTIRKTSYKDTPKVNVVDTVGAGDSFTAAFCAAMLKRLSIEEAHQLAVDVSAYVCTQRGAMPKLPEEIINRIK